MGKVKYNLVDNYALISAVHGFSSRHWLENLNWRSLDQITHSFWVSVGIAKKSGLSGRLEGPGDCSSRKLTVLWFESESS